MPVTDPRTGRTFIWLVSCILLLSIITGGGCLVLYMTLPETGTTSWLPVAGVTLVCLPWFFWFMTFLYRVISRVCGFRATTGGGGGGTGNNVAQANGDHVASDATDIEAPVVSPRNDVRRVQFGTAVVVGEQDKNHGGQEGKDQKRSSSRSSSSSMESHESEMPLAISMGS